VLPVREKERETVKIPPRGGEKQRSSALRDLHQGRARVFAEFILSASSVSLRYLEERRDVCYLDLLDLSSLLNYHIDLTCLYRS